LIGTVLRVVTLPLTILTLGLSALLVNAALVGITAGLTDYMSVSGFWAALFAGLLIAIFSMVLNALLHPRRRDR
jgi:putative membrane protein